MTDHDGQAYIEIQIADNKRLTIQPISTTLDDDSDSSIKKVRASTRGTHRILDNNGNIQKFKTVTMRPMRDVSS